MDQLPSLLNGETHHVYLKGLVLVEQALTLPIIKGQFISQDKEIIVAGTVGVSPCLGAEEQD